MRASSKALLGLVTVVVLAATLADDEPPDAPAPADPVPAVEAAGSAPPQPAPADEVLPAESSAELLHAAGDGDGDSWRDTAGREYRLGLVNTPETDECFGSEATAKRKELTAGGFRADVYETDAYSRSVAVVTLPDGTGLNVWLAQHGYANDTYLEQFRSENTALAAELDRAFAVAKADRAGMWGACSASAANGIAQLPAAQPSAAAPAPAAAGDCHPAYLTCIPIAGSGSGQGAANDLDCGQIRVPVQLRQVGVDPYRLDREGDGSGCEG